MKHSAKPDFLVIVPSWNGEKLIKNCIESILDQTQKCHLLVVDNGSKDNSKEIIKSFNNVILVENETNLGFAGGVNVGINYAIKHDYKFIALLNNDAVAKKDWIKELVKPFSDKNIAAVASKMLDEAGFIDSTGEFLNTWGLAKSRGRGEKDIGQYDSQVEIFAASGGASAYRVSTLKEVGLFDEDFFAYYEDVDLSFRLRHAGYKIVYQPKAVVEHKIGSTSSKVKGFTAYHSFKNMPLLLMKNLPFKYFFSIGIKFKLIYFAFLLNKLFKGSFFASLRGLFSFLKLMPGKIAGRRKILKNSKLDLKEFEELIIN